MPTFPQPYRRRLRSLVLSQQRRGTATTIAILPLHCMRSTFGVGHRFHFDILPLSFPSISLRCRLQQWWARLPTLLSVFPVIINFSFCGQSFRIHSFLTALQCWRDSLSEITHEAFYIIRRHCLQKCKLRGRAPRFLLLTIRATLQDWIRTNSRCLTRTYLLIM
jgi:hypothetical protein